MSHHVTATAQNPSGAVEVVHAQDQASAVAPLDLGSTGAGGLVRTSATQVEGVSRTRGANLPVEDIQGASNTIQAGKADLTKTVGAERRLDEFNNVGGGGGGAAAGGAADGQQNADNATGAPAQGSADTSVDSTGLGGQVTDTPDKAVSLNDLPDQDTRSLV